MCVAVTVQVDEGILQPQNPIHAIHCMPSVFGFEGGLQISTASKLRGHSAIRPGPRHALYFYLTRAIRPGPCHAL